MKQRKQPEHLVRAVRGLVMLAAGLCLGLACVAATAADTVNVGIISPQKTLEGKSIVNGAKLAAKHINANGGIDGKNVKLFFYDDQSSASDGVRAMQRASNQDHTVAMVGTFSSEVALAMEPWASRLKMPFLVSGAASPKISERVHKNYGQYKYVFRDKLNSHFMAESVIDFIKQQLAPKGFKLANIMAEDAAWTKVLGNTWQQDLEKKTGVKIGKYVRYSPSTDNFSPIFNQLTSNKARIILTGWAHTGVRPTVQWAQSKVPAMLVGVNAQAGSSNFYKASNGAAEGVISQTSAVPSAALSDKTRPFVTSFHKMFDNYPAYTGYTTYDAIYLLKNAIEAGGSTDADSIVSNLEKTDYTGVTGHIQFYGKNDKYTHDLKFGRGYVTGVIFQWQNNKQVPVWPPSVAKPVRIPEQVPQE